MWLNQKEKNIAKKCAVIKTSFFLIYILFFILYKWTKKTEEP